MMKIGLNTQDCEALSHDELKQIYHDHINPKLFNLLNSFSFSNETITNASGVWLNTATGKSLLDMTGGNGVLNLGHNHPEILKTRIDFQNKNKAEIIKSFLNPYLAGASYNLSLLLPRELSHSYFTNSGAESVEGALKLCFKYFKGERGYVLHSSTAFHGKMLVSGQLTGNAEKQFRFQKALQSDTFTYNDPQSLHELVKKHFTDKGSDVYAIIVEPFSATRVEKLSQDFFDMLEFVRKEYKIPIIFDEIYTGFFKTGPAFSFMTSNFVPDVLLCSKTLGGGKASLSAYVCRKHILEKAYPKTNEALLHSSTYNGFAEECATSVTALSLLLNQDWKKESERIERCIQGHIEKIKSKYAFIAGGRGQGALHCLEINPEHSSIIAAMGKIPEIILRDKFFTKKIILASIIDELFTKYHIYSLFMNNSQAALMITPSLVVTDQEIDYYFSSLDKVLSTGMNQLCFNFVKNNLSKRL